MKKEIYDRILKEIPDYKTFFTMDEMNESSRALAEEYPDIVSVSEIGKSRSGESMLCMKIGDGSHRGLMFGCPHPNEPIGTMMLEYFTRKLAEDREFREELDYTWYIVKVWDIDAFRMNSGWIKGPYTLYNYSRNFFRPAGYKQVDWTFPIDYKELHFHDSLPETEAMMKLIDTVKPEFIYSLHNAGFGGAYWYVTKDIPAVYGDFYEAADAQDVPVHLGEPEAPYCVPYAPAVYQGLGIRQDYDYMEKYTDADMSTAVNCGTCSADYASEKYGSFTLLTELPYFFDKRIKDRTESGKTRRSVVLEKCDWNDESNKAMERILSISEKYLGDDNPFLMAIKAFSSDDLVAAERKGAETDPEYERTATVAEAFDSIEINKFYKLLSYGMLIRAHEYELARMPAGEDNEERERVLRKACEEADKLHRDLADRLEKDIDYEVIDIRRLIGVQLGCGLVVADYLKNSAC